MKQFTQARSFVALIITALVISLAAPTGAVFAEAEISSVQPEVVESTPSDAAASLVDSESEVIQPDIQQPTSLEHTTATLSTPEPTIIPADVVTTPPSAPIPASPLLLTAYKTTAHTVEIVQLYNNSSELIMLDDVELGFVVYDHELRQLVDRIVALEGWIKPRSYLLVTIEGGSALADMYFSTTFAGVPEQIFLKRNGFAPIEVITPADYKDKLMQRFKSNAGNYTTNTSFLSNNTPIFGGGLYATPDHPTLEIREILVNPRDCLVGDKASDCYDFIKLRNTGSVAVDLSQYRLRTGFANTPSSVHNTTYFADVINPGETTTLTHDKNGARVSFSSNDGTVWFEDIYGLATFELDVSAYVGSGLTSRQGQSWAIDEIDGVWKWSLPSPGLTQNRVLPPATPGRGSGTSTDRVPCREDQFRSQETGRCRLIAATDTRTPCRADQYRSDETGRCRSVATRASSLTPCRPDQQRNPETNRCRSIASTRALADCAPGKERNPLTNRCRNIPGAVLGSTAHAPERVEDSRVTFAGWGLLIAIMALGFGYAVWEWRSELRRMFAKMYHKLPIRK